jgi:hypothetical protein
MTDTFRKVYRPLKEGSTNLILAIKEKAEEIEELLELIKTREKSLAMTNLEQCTMWATKAIVLEDQRLSND